MLENLAPDVLAELAAAYRRMADGTPQSRSQALTSCRRALKGLADSVYPATGAEVVGSDGVARKMTDDKFVARLVQFVYERRGGDKAARSTRAELGYLGARLGTLNDLASKGVHAAASELEVDQCVVHTYLVAGEVVELFAAT